MKTHRTDTLEVSPELTHRFDGAYQAARRVKSDKVFARFGKGARWKIAHMLWHKIMQGKIVGQAAETIRKDYADKFRIMDANGGRLPSGV